MCPNSKRLITSNCNNYRIDKITTIIQNIVSVSLLGAVSNFTCRECLSIKYVEIHLLHFKIIIIFRKYRKLFINNSISFKNYFEHNK